MASATVGNLCAKTSLRGNAPVSSRQARKAVSGRSALKVENNVKLTHVKQNTAQKLASMSYESGYIAYEALDITFVKNKLVVGADTSPGTLVDVLIPVNTISATHCELMATKDSVLVKDLRSTNGTYIDGVVVKGDVCVALPGQTISFDAAKGIEFIVELDTSVAKKMTPKMVSDAKSAEFPAFASEALMADRVEERADWISKFRAGGAVEAFTSEAGLAERVEERAAWIEASRSASKPTGAFTSEAGLTERVEERSSWISKYRTATAASSTDAGSSGKKLKVAINGFGRIGRNFVRCLESRGSSAPIEIVALNDSGGVKQAAHLLKYDSILGTFNADIKVTGDDTMTLNGREIKVVSNRNPLDLPWKELGVDIVIESTGVFIDEEGAGKHITAGAKKVVITAPGKGSIPTYVMGVNAHEMTGDEPIISNASCTTNGMACFVKVLEEEFGIIKGMMTTTHSYTGDQRLLDNSHRDARRARAAALNIVPTSTGAAKAVALVLPSVKGKLNGIALRVPTPNVSVVDLVVMVEKKTCAEEVNAAFRKAADGPMKGILAVVDEPLVGSDFKGTNVSSSIDSALTMVMGEDMVKVVAWYDNEWGYTQRVVDLTLQFAERGF